MVQRLSMVVSADSPIEEDNFMARKIRGLDRSRLTDLRAALDQISKRDARAAAAPARLHKVSFFPTADTGLQNALTTIRQRIITLLEMETS